MARAMDTYEARRRLLWAALNYASLEIGPSDETNDAHYDASLEHAEDMLIEASQQYVSVAGEPGVRTMHPAAAEYVWDPERARGQEVIGTALSDAKAGEQVTIRL